MAYEEIKITRRDMVRAEIESAINLLIEQDFVSAHVLAFSARAVLRGVAKAKGVQTMDDIFEDYIKPEYIKDWRKTQAESYNFFKHADEDPERELDNFRPEATAIVIFTTVINYGLVYKQWSLSMVMLRGWFFSRHPTFAKAPFDKVVESWKDIFERPEGKPLKDALLSLRKAIELIDRFPEEAFNLVPNESKGSVER